MTTDTAIAAPGHAPGWWDSYADMLPPAFTRKISLEATAARIRVYENRLIPGLLQTGGYAAAVMDTVRGETRAMVGRGMDLRMRRQAAVAAARTPVTAVVTETALRLVAGDTATMPGQYRRLADSARQGWLTLRVVPDSAGTLAGACHPFTLLDLDGGTVAFWEQIGAAELSSDPGRVGKFEAQFALYDEVALPAAESLALVTGLAVG